MPLPNNVILIQDRINIDAYIPILSHKYLILIGITMNAF